MNAPTTPSSRRATVAVCAGLLLLVAAVFGQTVGHGFLYYDDNDYITENALVSGGITPGGTLHAFTTFQIHNWHPVTILSHMADVSLFGLQAGWHHAVNVLLHAAAASCLFLALLAMTGALSRSAFVAAVFAVHPLHVESVAWIAERKDVLSGLFFMLTLLAYARYARNPFSLRNLLLVTGCFLLGLLSKPMLVTLPFVLLLLDFWPLGRLSRKDLPRLLLEKLPLFTLSGLAAAITLFAQRSSAMVALEKLPLANRFLNMPCGYGFYLQKTLWPEELALFYPLPATPPPLWQPAVWLLLLGAATVAAFLLRRTRPYLLTGWFWFLGMLFPVIGLLQSGIQAYADRYSYLPQTGLVIALTWLAADWAGGVRWRRLLLAAGGGAAVVTLALAAARQTSFWKNDETVWRHSLQCTRENASAHLAFGNALMAANRPEEALAEFRQALKVSPEFAGSRVNIARILLQKGEPDEAILLCREALEIDPDYTLALNNLAWGLHLKGENDQAAALLERSLVLVPNNFIPLNQLGLIRLEQGRRAEAEAAFSKSAQLNPAYPDAPYNLGLALLLQGRTEEALAAFRRAAVLAPDLLGAHTNIAGILLMQGRLEEAIPECRAALRIAPDSPSVLNNLAWALHLKGEDAQAVPLLEQSLRLDPRNPGTLNELGAILLSQGKAGEAVARFRQAIAIKPDFREAQEKLAEALVLAKRQGAEGQKVGR